MEPFKKYGKTPRLYRDVHITEKLDGTNAQITIMPATNDWYESDDWIPALTTAFDGALILFAGSRNRIIRPGKGTDNYGFAQFVHDNAEELATALGVGRHYGEWYGNGIARGYDLPEKRLALFSPRWQQAEAAGELPDRVEAVPLIKQVRFDQVNFVQEISDLVRHGSHAAPGFMNPEGIMVHHSASKQIYKLPIEPGNGFVKDPSPEELA